MLSLSSVRKAGLVDMPIQMSSQRTEDPDKLGAIQSFAKVSFTTLGRGPYIASVPIRLAQVAI